MISTCPSELIVIFISSPSSTTDVGGLSTGAVMMLMPMASGPSFHWMVWAMRDAIRRLATTPSMAGAGSGEATPLYRLPITNGWSIEPRSKPISTSSPISGTHRKPPPTLLAPICITRAQALM